MSTTAANETFTISDQQPPCALCLPAGVIGAVGVTLMLETQNRQLEEIVT
ncbi:MAG: hypothetical protein ABW292_18600 [Vicinamibacterales bacterium]